MSSREERVKVFEDTMKWCQDDDYLSASIDIVNVPDQRYGETCIIHSMGVLSGFSFVHGIV